MIELVAKPFLDRFKPTKVKDPIISVEDYGTELESKRQRIPMWLAAVRFSKGLAKTSTQTLIVVVRFVDVIQLASP